MNIPVFQLKSAGTYPQGSTFSFPPQWRGDMPPVRIPTSRNDMLGALPIVTKVAKRSPPRPDADEEIRDDD
jgi:hypothetical protein